MNIIAKQTTDLILKGYFSKTAALSRFNAFIFIREVTLQMFYRQHTKLYSSIYWKLQVIININKFNRITAQGTMTTATKVDQKKKW